MNISKIKTYKDLEKYCRNHCDNYSHLQKPCTENTCEIYKLCSSYNNADITQEEFLEKINIQARKEKLGKLLSS